jgi:hypothetical protein
MPVSNVKESAIVIVSADREKYHDQQKNNRTVHLKCFALSFLESPPLANIIPRCGNVGQLGASSLNRSSVASMGAVAIARTTSSGNSLRLNASRSLREII